MFITYFYIMEYEHMKYIYVSFFFHIYYYMHLYYIFYSYYIIPICKLYIYHYDANIFIISAIL